MKEVKVTNLVRFFTMLLLNEGPKHGYEIMKEVEKRLGKKPSSGQIYPFLNQLEKSNYIESKGREERDKKKYYLTKNGRVFANSFLVKFDSIVDTLVKSKLKICPHCKCEIYRGGYVKTSGDKKLTFCCIDCAKSYKERG